jgi:serine/threonine-protein kinase
MGDVYLACQVRLKRLVALKVIRDDLPGPALRERFQAEAEAVARLQHSNIVQIYEVGEVDGRPFLALEYVDGGSLHDHLRGTPLPPGRAAELVQVLARAVHHAHDRGLVHRDLKPANVLLAADGTPKVADFGLVRLISGGPGDEAGGAAAPAEGDTRVGAVVGTPSYMAPEQAAGAGDRVGPQTDVYALGAILYECLTGRPPFAGATLDETLAQVRGRESVPPRHLRPDVPRDLETVCLKCLEKDPDRRYASAQELADDLGRFLRGEPVRARPVGATTRLWKWARRRPVVAALSGVSALALAGLLVGGAAYQSLLRASDRQARRAQARAESNYRRALAAVEQLLTRVGGDRLVNVPEMDGVRAELLQDALRFYEGFLADADDPDPALRWETSLAHVRVAVIQHALGRPADADAHFRQAVDRLAALADAFPDRPDYRDGLADARRQYGDFLASWTDPRQAGEQFDRARQLWLDLAAADPADARYPARVALCDHLTGWWHDAAGRMAEAEAAYDRALAGRREAVARAPTADARRDLAMTLHNLAVVHSRTRRPATAVEHEAEAVALFEALARANPGDDETRGRWSAGLHNLGVLQSHAGHPDDARRCYEQALGIREALAKGHPLVPNFQAAWAATCMALAAEDMQQLRRADTEPLARQAVTLYDRLSEQWPQNSGYAASLLGALTNLALLYQSSKRPGEAAAVYDRARAVAERLIAAQPDNPHHATALAALCLNRGNLDGAGGRPRDALAWYDRSIAAADRALARDVRLADARTWRLYAHGARGQVCEQMHDYAAAVRSWDRVVELSDATDRRTYRLLRTTALARAGAYDRTAAEAAALAAETADPAELVHLAGACAAAAARAKNDSALPAGDRRPRSDALAAQALALWRRAASVADLRQRLEIALEVFKNPDLRALTGRADGQPPASDTEPR